MEVEVKKKLFSNLQQIKPFSLCYFYKNKNKCNWNWGVDLKMYAKIIPFSLLCLSLGLSVCWGNYVGQCVSLVFL